MIKRIIVTVAIILVGNIGIISNVGASPITIKGNTTANLYGFVWYQMGWSEKIGNISWANVAYKAKSGSNNAQKKEINKIRFSSTATITRIGLKFDNKATNTSGIIETDFFLGGKLSLRRAFVKHNFGNEYILIGQEWTPIETQAYIFSALWSQLIPTWLTTRYSQVQIGGSFYLSKNITFQPKLALMDNSSVIINTPTQIFSLANGSTFTGVVDGSDKPVGIYTLNSNGQYISITPTAVPTTLNRNIFPTIALNLGFNIKTGFGSPANIYVQGEVMPANELAYKKPYENSAQEHYKTSYAVGGGILFPINIITFGFNYLYEHGEMIGGTLNNNSGGFIRTPASFIYAKGSNSIWKLVTRIANSWGVETKIRLMPSLNLAGGYDTVLYSNNNANSDYFLAGETKSTTTIHANISYKTTKHTLLTFEWDNFHTKYAVISSINRTSGADFDNAVGNAYWIRYMYFF